MHNEKAGCRRSGTAHIGRRRKIAQHTGALKAFSNLYLYRVMEYIRSDLLSRVEPYRPKPEQHRDSSRKNEVKEFSAAELDALMSCHDTATFLGIRD